MALTGPERDALDRRGFLLLNSALSTAMLSELRNLFERELTPGASQTGTRHTDLSNQPLAIEACSQPHAADAISYLLGGDFVITCVHGRDPLPGFGQQGLHGDWHTGFTGEVQSVTSLVYLDDFGPENGGTRLVPGTHRLPNRPDKRTADPANIHPQQEILTGPAGSILVFSAHLWHSGMRNNSNRSRRALQATYSPKRFGRA